jgi:uncharacterized protein (DUF779 family)
MFKAFLNIIIAANLFVTTTGFTISRHYCGDELSGIAIDHKAPSCCDSSCHKCHTEEHFVKLEQDLTTPVHFEKLQIAQLDLMVPTFIIFDQEPVNHTQEVAYKSESPPGRTGPDILTQFQSFLI